ncbi:hypothetical protein [Streptomyces sp. NPDC101145]|uniref:hypothetical protein n=1 Tax=Streptomyces sp. NPDC101145 TaxID=3366112 RepID=UPI00382E3F58
MTAAAAADAAESLRQEARTLADEVLAWAPDGKDWPSRDQAVAAMHQLNAYGEHLRDAVQASVRPGSPGGPPPILSEAHGRLNQPLTSPVPPFILTTDAVVRRAQNLARLVTGLLSALGAGPSHPPAPGGNTHQHSTAVIERNPWPEPSALSKSKESR